LAEKLKIIKEQAKANGLEDRLVVVSELYPNVNLAKVRANMNDVVLSVYNKKTDPILI